MITVRAHAKINLSLRVLGVRPDDGYHDLRTVFQALALHDTLRLVPRPGRFAIESDEPRLPLDAGNLVWRAATLLWEYLGRAGEPSGVLVQIDKCIPMKGGLGGGSADAAAALVGLARVWDADVDAEALRGLARRLGADVAFFFTGGAALGEGRGDQLYPLPDLPSMGVLLVVPAFDVSTAEAYRWVDEARGWTAEVRKSESPKVRKSDCDESNAALVDPGTLGHASLDGARDALSDSRRGDSRTGRIPNCPWPEPLDEVVNDFEAVVAARHPQLRAIIAAMRGAGATVSAMTGSGSTVFGLFEDDSRLDAAAEHVREFGRVLVTRTLSRAAYLESSTPRE